jgi:hypothetical protein
VGGEQEGDTQRMAGMREKQPPNVDVSTSPLSPNQSDELDSQIDVEMCGGRMGTLGRSHQPPYLWLRGKTLVVNILSERRRARVTRETR